MPVTDVRKTSASSAFEWILLKTGSGHRYIGEAVLHGGERGPQPDLQGEDEGQFQRHVSGASSLEPVESRFRSVPVGLHRPLGFAEPRVFTACLCVCVCAVVGASRYRLSLLVIVLILLGIPMILLALLLLVRYQRYGPSATKELVIREFPFPAHLQLPPLHSFLFFLINI